MTRTRRWPLWALTLQAVQPLVACNGPSTMAQRQIKAPGLRHCCERMHDVQWCHGFMGSP